MRGYSFNNNVTKITIKNLTTDSVICNDSYIVEAVLIIGIMISGFILGWNLGIILSSLISMSCKKYRR